jgi:hypothetical protein
MRRPTWLATGIALALLIGLGACSNDDPPPSADHRTTTTRATTSTASTTTTKPKSGYVKAKVDPSLPRQDIDINLRYPATFTPAQVEVVQAWANYRHVFYATADPPDPDSGLLERFASASSAAILRSQRQELMRSGVAARIPRPGALAETVTAVEVSDGHAHLTTCEIDGVVQVKIASGQVVDDEVLTRLIDANFERTSRGWLAAPGQESKRWPGRQEATCLEAS